MQTFQLGPKRVDSVSPINRRMAVLRSVHGAVHIVGVVGH
jgi:hypothetical protein